MTGATDTFSPEERTQLKTCHYKCEFFAEKIFVNLVRNGHRDAELEEIANLSIRAAAIFYDAMEKSRWQIDKL